MTTTVNVGCNSCYFGDHVDCTGGACLCDCRSKAQLERARELAAAFIEEEKQRSHVFAQRALDKARSEYDGSDRTYSRLMYARYTFTAVTGTELS